MYNYSAPCTDPIYLDFKQNKIGHVSLAEAKSKYKRFYKCSGLWNRGCRECTFEELERLVNWMYTGDYYESSDGTALFIHGFSVSDMY